MEVSAVVVDIACMLIADWENANSTPSNLLLHTQGQQVQTTTHLQQNSHQHHPQTATVTHQWLPLSLGRYKCNIDAAFSNQFQQTGIGEMILKPSCWLKHYISTNFTSQRQVKLWGCFTLYSGCKTCTLILFILSLILRLQRMHSIHTIVMLQNLEASLPLAENCSLSIFITPGQSLLGDKRIRLLMLSLEKPFPQLVPQFIMLSQVVSNRLL